MPRINQEFKPAVGGWVTTDKQYQLSEVRLRFPVDANFSVTATELGLLLYIAKDLNKGIENLEKFRGYRKCEYVPRKREFGGKQPCCDQMKQPYGTPLQIKLEHSPYQGDPGDGELADSAKRLYVEGKVDWVAILHFWVPTISYQTEGEREEMNEAYSTGAFTPWDKMPENAWPVIRKRFESNES